jgi:flavin prenyltransferase
MKFIVALTGASATIVGVRLIEELKKVGEVITLVSESGQQVSEIETGKKITPDYDWKEFTAPIASTSNNVDAVIVCPCSVATLGKIANGITDNLITRVSDGCLRTGGKLIVCPRETPISLPQAENMTKVLRAGGIVLPLNVAFYNKPANIDDMVNFFVGKIMDCLNLENDLYKRWKA